MARRVKPILAASLLALLVLGGTGAWLFWPDPPPPDPPQPTDEDTGLTRQQTEDLMRSIGYVQ